MAQTDPVFDKGLPAAPDVERLILGMALLNSHKYWDEIADLKAATFSIEKHRRIFATMERMRERDVPIDKVTLCEELNRDGLLESVDGMGYIVSLDDGLPEYSNLDQYIKILRDKAMLRRMIFDSQAIINQCILQSAEPEVIAAKMESKARDVLSLASVRDGGRTPYEVVDQFPGGVNSFMNPSLRPQGLHTGLTKFDEMTGGLKPGLYILGGRTSHGKSAMAMRMVEGVVAQDIPVSIFAFEMSAASLMDRMLCSRSRIDSKKFRLGYLSSDERSVLHQNLKWLLDRPMLFYDKGSSFEQVARFLTRDVKRDGVKLGVIDYLQLFGRDRRGGAENRNNEIAAITRNLKILSGELGIPILLLSQVSRSPDKRGSFRPMVSDLRDSGAIEEDADLVMFVFREWLYRTARTDLYGKAELLIGKQRDGPIGDIPLTFSHNFARFDNAADPNDKEEPVQ